MARRGRKSAAQTPAPLKDRIRGSAKNPKGSAASAKSAKSIELSSKVIKSLENKRDEYNSTHSKKVTLATLKAVYRRGAGAYSSSHRPNISRNAWAMARVDKFLLKKSGKKVKAAYVQDDDLMADGGMTSQIIKCVRCAWTWDTADSDESDKYVCHKCGFDNRTYYDVDPIGNYHLGGEMSKHLAPNGKPSNLTHEQWHLVRTPEFKAWFGDWENDPENASKVVDENGEPLVVYRGWSSNQKFGNVFTYDKNLWGQTDTISRRRANRFGFYFTSNKKVAEIYANDFAEAYNSDLSDRKSNKPKSSPIVEEYFLNIRNICDFTPINKNFPSLETKINDAKKSYRGRNIKDIIQIETSNYSTSIGLKSLSKIVGFDKKDMQDELSDNLYATKYDSNFPSSIFSYMINDGDGFDLFLKNKIIENKHDGVKFEEDTNYYSSLTKNEKSAFDKKDKSNQIQSYPVVYVSFNPNQIKLADGSNVTFDPNNPDIRYHLGGEMSKHLAPNGKPSNLTHEQWHLVRTPEFKAWFGDWENDPQNASKIVDENGEPKVCVHGSRSKFTTFDLSKGGESNKLGRVGFWFSPIKGFGINFTKTSWWGEMRGDEGIEYDVFLSIKNPKVFVAGDKDEMWSDSYERFRTDVYAVAGMSARDANIGGLGMAMQNSEEVITKYRNLLVDKGYDGIIIKQTRFDRSVSGGLNDQIVALYPEQIKLSDGSNKTFDAMNPDIRYKDGGETGDCIPCRQKAEKGMEIELEIEPKSDKLDIEELNRVLGKFGYEAIKKGEYPIGKVAAGMSIQDIAHRHKYPIQTMKKSLELGIKTEMEHTSDKRIAEKIALDHLYEDPEYYEKLQKIEKLYRGSEIDYDFNKLDQYIENGERRTDISLYLRDEKIEAKNVLHANDSKLSKGIICKHKIEYAQSRLKNADTSLEENFWEEYRDIWMDCMNKITRSDIVNKDYFLEDVYYYAKGGLAYGNSHAKGGIPLYNKGAATMIEIEGGEGVVKKDSMQMTEELEFEGQKMTACEIVSKINQMTGGVKFKCSDVKKIIQNDGKYS